MFYLWLVFHADLDYRKISLLIQGISFYLYIPLSLSSSCLLCAVYIPPVLHVLNIVFICYITFVSPILYLSLLMYKGLKGTARIPTDDLIPKNRRCRNQHSLVFQIPSASKDSYKKSFFPQTIRDWNALPDSLISSAELSDDCVYKFTSLVRARD